MQSACKICQNAQGNRLHTAREMSFGLRDQFIYLECGHCGCVQIVEIPSDMGKYYAANYYSLQPHGKLKTIVRRKWAAHAFGRKSLTGWLFTEFFFAHRSMLAVRRVNPPKTARILDVGCGQGNLLQDLAWLGYTNLTGVDPFLQRDLVHASGVTVFKRHLSEMPGQFDLIMLHHSFEHMEQPRQVMAQVAGQLSPGGQVILGIPIASSFAWKHYGVNWANLDAPRHFFLHTTKSIELLAAKCGLVIEKVVHEGNDEQFWLSEQYAKDIPANDSRSLKASPVKTILAYGKIRACRARAEEINRKQQGDLACFHLSKPS